MCVEINYILIGVLMNGYLIIFPDHCEISHKDNRHCSMDDMPIVSDFELDHFSGSWYSYAEFKGGSSFDMASLFLHNNDDELLVIFRGQRSVAIRKYVYDFSYCS